MSQDQKPARIRMVSGGATPAGRRRDDDQNDGVQGAAATAPMGGAAAPEAGARTSGVMLSVIFILGCAAGAIGLTLSGVL